MTTNTEQLLPCPFCGSQAKMIRTKGESLWSHDQVEWTQVQCTNDDCGIETDNRCEGWEPTPAETWNARAALTQPAQVVEASPLSARCYAMSETHLSGARLIIGFSTLEEAGQAHQWVANLGKPIAQTGEADTGPHVLREVFALCEATEDAEVAASSVDSQAAQDFMRGRKFEAKQIRKAIGTWFQDEFCGRSFMGEPVTAPTASQEPTGDKLFRQFMGEADRAGVTHLAITPASQEQAPIPMVLHCPKCGLHHIDAPEGQFYPGHTAEESKVFDEQHGVWTNPPHRSHLCHGCGTIWRPADVPTTGVASVSTKGKADTWEPGQEQAQQPAPCDGGTCGIGGYCDACPKQQPSGGEVSDAPERIWLQINADGSPEDTGYPSDHEGVTWCWHSIGGQEVEYVRADLAKPQSSGVQALTLATPKPEPMPSEPRRDDFVRVARIFARAYGLHEDAPKYLPRTIEAAQVFEPHGWVIAAMMQAFADGQFHAKPEPMTDAEIEAIAQTVCPIVETGQPSWEHAVIRAYEQARSITSTSTKEPQR